MHLSASALAENLVLSSYFQVPFNLVFLLTARGYCPSSSPQIWQINSLCTPLRVRVTWLGWGRLFNRFSSPGSRCLTKLKPDCMNSSEKWPGAWCGSSPRQLGPCSHGRSCAPILPAAPWGPCAQKGCMAALEMFLPVCCSSGHNRSHTGMKYLSLSVQWICLFI